MSHKLLQRHGMPCCCHSGMLNTGLGLHAYAQNGARGGLNNIEALTTCSDLGMNSQCGQNRVHRKQKCEQASFTSCLESIELNNARQLVHVYLGWFWISKICTAPNIYRKILVVHAQSDHICANRRHAAKQTVKSTLQHAYAKLWAN